MAREETQADVTLLDGGENGGLGGAGLIAIGTVEEVLGERRGVGAISAEKLGIFAGDAANGVGRQGGWLVDCGASFGRNGLGRRCVQQAGNEQDSDCGGREGAGCFDFHGAKVMLVFGRIKGES